MKQKRTLLPHILALMLATFVVAGSAFAWTLPALAANATIGSVRASSSGDLHEKVGAAEESKQTRATTTNSSEPSNAPSQDENAKEAGDTYTIFVADGQDDAANIKAYDHGDGTVATAIGSKEGLFSQFYEGSTDNLSCIISKPNGHVTYDPEDDKFLVLTTFDNTVTITFTIPDSTDEYPVYITCKKGAPWDGEDTAEGEAIYGLGDEVDLTDCLPDEDTDNVTFGTPTIKDDADSILDGPPSVADGKLSFKFVDNASKVGKTAEVIVPITQVKDDEYSPYRITVTLKVLDIDKDEQEVSAENVEGTVGDTGKSISASTSGDGELSYTVIEGKDYVDVDEETGELTLKKEGEATVRVTASETDSYKVATKDVTVKVNPKPTHTVIVTNDGHGTAKATPSTAAQGTTVTLKATPNDGYEFDSWTVVEGDITIKDDTFEMPDSNVKVKANFKKTSQPAEKRSITFDANGGTGTMNKQTAEKGSIITLNANKFKRTGYTFTGWNTKKDGTGSSFKNRAKVKLNADTTLYAQWKKKDSSNKQSNKKSTPSTPSNSSSSSLAKTGDPTNIALIANLAIGGGALVCAGRFVSKKRVKDDIEDEAETKSE